MRVVFQVLLLHVPSSSLLFFSPTKLHACVFCLHTCGFSPLCEKPRGPLVWHDLGTSSSVSSLKSVGITKSSRFLPCENLHHAFFGLLCITFYAENTQEQLITSRCQHFINVGIQENFSTLYHKIGFVPYDFAYLRADYQLVKGELLDLWSLVFERCYTYF